MTKKELDRFCGVVAHAMLPDILAEIEKVNAMPDMEISAAFECRMRKIARRADSPFRFMYRVSKAAVIVFVCIAITLSVTLGVEAVRKPIQQFFVHIFESIAFVTTTDYDPLEPYPKAIDENCSPTYIPYGFSLRSGTETKTSLTSVYKNSNGDEIIFTQDVLTTLSYVVPEAAAMIDDNLMINGIEGRLYSLDGRQYAMWQNEYLYTISVPEGFPTDELVKMCETAMTSTQKESLAMLNSGETDDGTCQDIIISDMRYAPEYIPEGYHTEKISATGDSLFTCTILNDANDKDYISVTWFVGSRNVVNSITDPISTTPLTLEDGSQAILAESDRIWSIMWETDYATIIVTNDKTLPESELIKIANSVKGLQ